MIDAAKLILVIERVLVTVRGFIAGALSAVPASMIPTSQLQKVTDGSVVTSWLVTGVGRFVLEYRSVSRGRGYDRDLNLQLGDLRRLLTW